jgi:hypothetical protein
MVTDELGAAPLDLCAAERVLDVIGATGDHEEGRGDQREKAQPSAFVLRVRWI